MPPIPAQCFVETDESRPTRREGGLSFAIENRDHRPVLVVDVDKCVYKNAETRRCDWLFVYNGKYELFVELKGSDIKHAITQFEAPIRDLATRDGSRKRYAYIVYGQYPAKTPGKDILALKFYRATKTPLFFASHHAVFDPASPPT